MAIKNQAVVRIIRKLINQYKGAETESEKLDINFKLTAISTLALLDDDAFQMSTLKYIESTLKTNKSAGDKDG